jgi:hypothetical protein
LKSMTDLKQEAAARGDLTFSTGKPCKRGHTVQRYTSTGACLECLNPKIDKPLSVGQALMVQKYRFEVLVPVELTAERIAQLDTYLYRCGLAFAQHAGETRMAKFFQAIYADMADAQKKSVFEVLRAARK